MLDGKRCKILTCALSGVEAGPERRPGEFWKSENALLVATRSGVLELGDIVLEGKPRRKAAEVLVSGIFE